MKPFLFIMMLLVSCLFGHAQQVTNVHFEQDGKKINIYYDMQGEGTYVVKAYCSEDEGKNWDAQLQSVTGAVGENQNPGINKMIVWDVLAEREKIAGNIQFKIEAKPSELPDKFGTFIDPRDGKVYKWVRIGDKMWMAENLNYYTTDSWCYKNSQINCEANGRLYTWFTAMNACPTNWDLPSDDEWKTLEKELGISQKKADNVGWRGLSQGNQMKSTYGWMDNGFGDNSSGFNAIPGGYFSYDGKFSSLGVSGCWWSATEYNTSDAWRRMLGSSFERVRRNTFHKGSGLSVRCVKD